MGHKENRRVLIIDDNESIHVDFRKVIGTVEKRDAALDNAAAALFGDEPAAPSKSNGFEIESAYQGEQGLELVQQSLAQGRPFAMAFVDVRMPPGWDGIETIQRIWRVDPDIQIVLCTAYSDYSWAEMTKVLGETDCWLILKKPFDNIEVRQITAALVAKWNLAQKANQAMHNLLEMVRGRTAELDKSVEVLRQQIAEREKSEEALRETEGITRAIIETAPNAILAIDQAGFIESLNSAAEHIFGFAHGEIVGKKISLLLPALADTKKTTMKPCDATPTMLHQVSQARRSNGTTFPADVSWSQVRFKDRTLYTVILRDLTEQTPLEVPAGADAAGEPQCAVS